MPLADHIPEEPLAIVPTPGGRKPHAIATLFFTPENRAGILALMDSTTVRDSEGKEVARPGATLKLASEMMGLSWHTVKGWMLEGQYQLAFYEGGGLVRGRNIDLMEFAREVKKREAMNIHIMRQGILNDADKSKQGINWAARMTIMERENPDEYGQVQKQQVDVKSTSTEVKVIWHRVDGEDWMNKQAAIPGVKPPQIEADDVVDTTFAEEQI